MLKYKMEKKKESFPCPCGGRIEWKKKKVVIDGVNCGLLETEICKKCGSEYFPESSMEVIEKKLKEAGIWGMQRKEVSFWKSGNSVVIRIPVKIAASLGLKPAMRGNIYKENNRLVIEI